MRCKYCGTENPDIRLVCQKCGAKLDDPAESQNSNKAQPLNQNDSYNSGNGGYNNQNAENQYGNQVQYGDQNNNQYGNVQQYNNNQYGNGQQYNNNQYGGQYYQNDSTGYAQGEVVEEMKTDRSFVLYLLLSIVTCGIYGYWFIYTMARDINTMSGDEDDKLGGLVAYILLSIITCGIYDWFWNYKLGNLIHETAPKYNTYISETGSSILMWRIFGILLCGFGSFYAIYLQIKNMNKLSKAYNAKHFGNR